MGAGRLYPPSEFDPDREAIFHFPWSRFQSCKLTPDLMSTTRSVWFFVIALTVIRLSMLATTDLEFDEAHYWITGWPWISLEIHERARACFDYARTCAGPPAPTGVCPARFVFIAWRLWSLHDPADCLEHAARLDYANPSPVAWGY